MSIHLAYLALIIAHGAHRVQAASYALTTTYAGSTFLDDWTFYGNYDNTTLGDVTWVNRSTAAASPKLVETTASGNTILRVDNTSTVDYNYKRNSVRITSNEYYDVGSVWVLDATHLPYGCSVWPGFWSTGDNWPKNGEIDTMEGVNNVQASQMALHTESGCTQASGVTQSGHTNSTDCDYSVDDNVGCAVTDSSSKSYGEAFSKAGGGVFVTEYATSGINIWFFSRADIPSAVTANSSIDTSNLGTPSASWPKSSCDIDKYFGPQRLVFDITLCGSWAGTASVLAETCPALSGTSTCYTTYVLDANNYDTAYFEIVSLKVYGKSSSSSSGASPSLGSSSRAFAWTMAGASGAVALLLGSSTLL